MSKKLKALLVGVFAMLALSALANTASAASITTNGGTFTATTTGLQTLQTTTSLVIPISVTCNQTITLNQAAGTYTVGSLTTAWNISAANFACNPTILGPANVTALNLPWRGARINSANATTALITALNVSVNATGTGVNCNFGPGTVNFSTNNGVATGQLLGAALPASSGGCTGSVISAQGYRVTPALTWTYTP
jgi:hypothetical protein